MPIRIGIAYGECFIDNTRNVFLGDSIINAHLTEESQNWIGGACHKSCRNGPIFNSLILKNFFVSYNVPLKLSSKTVPMNFGLTWPNFTEFFSRKEIMIGW